MHVHRFICRVVWVVAVFIGLGTVLPASRVQAQEADPATQAIRAQQLFVRGLTKAYLDQHETALDLYLQALQAAPDEAAILSAVAASQEALGDYSTALFYAEQAQQAAPDNAFYYHQLAGLQVRAGNVQAGIAALHALLDRFPDDRQALQELAQLQSMAGRSREAIATYDRLLELAGDHAEVRQHMLQLYFRLGDEQGTRETLEALTALDPNDPAPFRLLGQLHLQQNQPDAALEAFQEAYDVDPSDFETILALADVLRQMDRSDEADSLLSKAMQVQDGSAEELVASAKALAAQAATDPEAAQAARQLLDRALAIRPDHPEALLLLGNLLYNMGLYAEAAPLLEQALQEDPRNPDTWARAAGAFLEAGLPEDAARVADEGLLLFPGQLPLLRVTAHSLLATEQDDEAIEHFEDLLTLLKEEYPDAVAEQAETLAALGLLYSRRNETDAADAYYAQALDADPDNARALSIYAYGLALREDHLSRALEMAQRAVDLDPDNPAYLDTLGWVYLKLNRLDEARARIGEALEKGGASAMIFEHNGDVHAQLGDWETARTYWQRALERAPGDADLLRKLERQQH